jgi:hypothetical protein
MNFALAKGRYGPCSDPLTASSPGLNWHWSGTAPLARF